MIPKFVIVSPPRVGSNLLLQVLNGTSEAICCFPELFHPTAKDIMADERFLRPSMPYFHQVGLNPREYLDLIVWGEQTAAFESVGFKVQPHLDFAYESIAAARELGAEFLYLTRLDKVEMVLSVLIAEARKKWWYFDDKSQARQQIRVVPQRAAELARQLKIAEQKMIAFLPKSTKVMTYERLFEGGFEAILKWLGTDGQPNIGHESIPQKSPDKSQELENYLEISAIVRFVYSA